jgi:sporulation-control protein spo0M
MSQKEKNMVMIGAAQVNNTLNENALMPGTIKQQQQSNVTSTKIRAGCFI